MSRNVLQDGSGAHDLGEVVAVLPHVLTDRTGKQKTLATLLYVSGASVNTNTDFAAVVKQWSAGAPAVTAAPAAAGK